MVSYVDDMVYGTPVYEDFFADVDFASKQFSLPHFEALYMYTQGDYRFIRDYLNGVGSVDKSSYVTSLDETMDLIPAKERVVYRGLRLSNIEDAFKVGETFVDPSYMSCSLNLHVAKSFVQKFDDAVILHIVAKNGVPLGDDTSSRGRNEREVLLPRDSKFIVESINYDAECVVGGVGSKFTVVELRQL